MQILGWGCLTLAGAMLVSACGRPPERSGGPAVGWPVYTADSGGGRYSPLDEINAANVAYLERVWEFRTGDLYDRGGRPLHQQRMTQSL